MKNREIATQSPWTYFIIAFGFSWLFWIPAAFVNGNIPDWPWAILLYIGGIGPAVGGILLTYLNPQKAVRRDYWQRVFNPKRIGGIWYLAALLAYPLLTLLLAFAENGQIQTTESFKELLSQPLGIIPFVIFIFLFGPFPEELGWRGFALDGLQKRMNAVWASLLLGAVWAIWHIPLFFMNGTYQNELGVGSAAFWRFMIFPVVISIFFTWIYNSNQRSILSAALFHFSHNFTGNIIDTSGTLETQRILILVLLGIVVVWVYGVKEMKRESLRRDVERTHY
jgi:membrane protease YdiL (CAAX protease family)